MVVAIKSYTNFDTKGGENALFYWGYGHFKTRKSQNCRTAQKCSFTIYLQLVFEAKISTIITIKKNERMTKMKITYRQVCDYMIPKLKLPPEESNIRLGKWGMMYKDYLQKHKPTLFAALLTQGTIYQHCAEIEKHAQQMFTTLVSQMAKSENITEDLKAQNQLEWVQRMNSIHERASEVVCNELIYVWVSNDIEVKLYI